nr:heavy metal-binding domain-containing protein [Polyangiaceae bacterium]
SSNLGTLANYTEFLAQGTAVHSQVSRSFFSTAASGIETYCHLDAGYEPVRFVMGNIAYALGIGRGLTGSLRQLAKGEVKEFSQMYNRIRHLALDRIKLEAHQLGANAVVDIATEILPFGPGTIEILMTGTASRRANLPPCASNMSAADHVVTSELSGEELWNLAKLGFVPVRLVMATSVYSLGVAAGIGAMLKSMSRGEIPEVTKLVYEARENCIALLREEAIRSGGERVIGNRLMIRELSPGLIEVVAIGTAVKRAPGFEPETPQLIPQAVITENRALSMSRDLPALPNFSPTSGAAQFQPSLGSAGGCLTGIVLVAIFFVVPMVIGFIALLKK